PLSQRGQLAGFRAGIPNRGPIRQQKFGPPPPGLFLLPGQPIPQGAHEIVVGQLVVTGGRWRVTGGGGRGIFLLFSLPYGLLSPSPPHPTPPHSPPATPPGSGAVIGRISLWRRRTRSSKCGERLA